MSFLRILAVLYAQCSRSHVLFVNDINAYINTFSSLEVIVLLLEELNVVPLPSLSAY